MEVMNNNNKGATSSNLLNRRPTAVRWIKEWVPQKVIGKDGKCSLFKWVTEDKLRALREKADEGTKVEEPEEQKPILPTKEELFLCTYKNCGKAFPDYGALRKHSHVHGERQHVCTYQGCGKKFLDSSKLKRHYKSHTGQRDYVCPHDGCGKAFSLDFNLRAHMKTHAAENYHFCPYYEDCKKRFTQEYKLLSHLKTYHEKGLATDTRKPNSQSRYTPKVTAVDCGPSAERPYACPYEGCGKAYIHEYKLKLHLRQGHPGHNPDNNQDAYFAKGNAEKGLKRKKPNSTQKMPQAKVPKQEGASPFPGDTVGPSWQQLPSKELYENDSEETEDEDDAEEERWRYRHQNSDNDETEDED